ncbi:MAG: hypothetical protein IPN17_28225 [Deltaproteobacteria bacterium]|nr:hypothetical protein [Deltaproteobacteria bacterium]MBK8696043.1 hypothetical protein [Deltaproteobacteria bacterium]MBP6829468.1 hypothetical protein [Deltaproteobacteria bacterium]
MTERSFDPSDEEVHADLMEQLLLGIHVAMPGRIQSYDSVHQVADIVLQVRHRYPDPDGSGQYFDEDYPVLPAVPIFWPRMGKWFWAASVEAGDAVQVLFNSSALGIWRRSTATDALSGLDRAIRGVSTVGDVGRHSLTHAVALLGMETYSQALAHAPPFVPPTDPDACLTLGSDLDDGTRLSIYGDGSMKITRGSTVVIQIDAAGTIQIGGTGLTALLDGLVTARGVDPFTGATYGALGNASAVVMAKK